MTILCEDADGQGTPGRSAPHLMLSDTQGYWYVSLNVFRTADGSNYFSCTAGDNLILFAEGGIDGQDYEVWSLISGGPPLVLTPCPWDLNSDNVMTAPDLTIAAIAWGTAVGRPSYNALADLDGSHTIDVIDLMRFAAYWNQTCP